MGSETNIGMVGVGGAIAFVLVWLIQWLAPGAPVTPELSVAFGTIFTLVLAYILPPIDRRPRRRTNRHDDVERLAR